MPSRRSFIRLRVCVLVVHRSETMVSFVNCAIVSKEDLETILKLMVLGPSTREGP
jgi:hypothetical protein